MAKSHNKLQFTEKENQVFQNIIKHPDLNDTKLSKKTGINRTTITAIRNKFYEKKLYFKVRIRKLCPDECEILNISTFRLNPLDMSHMDKKYIHELFDSPEMIFGILSEDKLLGIFLTKNYTEFYKISPLNKLSEQSDTSERINNLHFPIKLSRIPLFFNYTSLLNSAKSPVKNTDDNIILKKCKKKVTRGEKHRLYTLIKYPHLNDGQIANIINVQRPRITQVRNKFTKSGIIKILNIPDITKLPYEFITLCHFKFKSEATIRDVEPIIELALSGTASIFVAYNSREGTLLCLSKNITDYEQKHKQFIDHCKKNSFLLKKVTPIHYSINNSKIRELDFAPLLKKMLD